MAHRGPAIVDEVKAFGGEVNSKEQGAVLVVGDYSNLVLLNFANTSFIFVFHDSALRAREVLGSLLAL